MADPHRGTALVGGVDAKLAGALNRARARTILGGDVGVNMDAMAREERVGAVNARSAPLESAFIII